MSEDAKAAVAGERHPVHVRFRAGLRKPHNWLQFVKFCAVGGSGYVVNLIVFTLCVELLGFHHLVAATAAFVVAVTNNFWWNRHWTFAARSGRASLAARFLAVSVARIRVSSRGAGALVASSACTRCWPRPSRSLPPLCSTSSGTRCGASASSSRATEDRLASRPRWRRPPRSPGCFPPARRPPTSSGRGRRPSRASSSEAREEWSGSPRVRRRCARPGETVASSQGPTKGRPLAGELVPWRRRGRAGAAGRRERRHHRAVVRGQGGVDHGSRLRRRLRAQAERPVCLDPAVRALPGAVRGRAQAVAPAAPRPARPACVPGSRTCTSTAARSASPPARLPGAGLPARAALLAGFRPRSQTGLSCRMCRSSGSRPASCC